VQVLRLAEVRLEEVYMVSVLLGLDCLQAFSGTWLMMNTRHGT